MESILTLTGLLYISVGVQGTQLYSCRPHKVCNNTDDIVTAILSDQGNYHRLMEAFYPINHAVPQFVSLIFFANGTPISQPLCNQTPYVGMIMELSGEENVHAAMWYSSTSYMTISASTLTEAGLLLPVMTLGLLFKKTTIISSYSAACLTVPYIISKDEVKRGFLLQTIDSVSKDEHALCVWLQ